MPSLSATGFVPLMKGIGMRSGWISCGFSFVGRSACRYVGPWVTACGRSEPAFRNRIARVLFCLVRDRIVVLHGFIKKTQKTPDEELSLARKRKKEFED